MKKNRQGLLDSQWKISEQWLDSGLLEKDRKNWIAPSILSADFANLQREIEKVAKAGADWIHVDVMDGHFVPNLTLGAPIVASLSKICPLPLDVHLMIEEPEKYIESFAKAGSDILTIHVEATSRVGTTLDKIRRAGMRSGLSLRPKTPLDEVLPFLSQTDLLLVMTVEPGFGGQSFMSDQVEKIRQLRNEVKNIYRTTGHRILIEVDGGINDKTHVYCKEADVLVAGSYVFNNVEYVEAIASLR